MSAEKSVLGAMMLEVPALKRGLDRLTPSDFVVPANREIFKAITKLHGEGKLVDIVTLSDELDGNKELEAMDGGGLLYLSDVMRWVPSAANIEAYIVMCQENAREVRIEAALDGIQRADQPLLALLERLVEREKAAIAPVSDGMDTARAVEEFIEELVSPKQDQWFRTGIPSIDDEMGGLPRGLFVVIAARPRVGKTSWALNIAMRNVRDRYKVLFVSREMPRKKLLNRLAAMSAAVDYGTIIRRKNTPEEISRISDELVEMVMGERLNIVDDIKTATGIRREIERIRPDLVIVDYIQKVKADRNYQDKKDTIEEVVDTFKDAAMDNDCCIIALSQINRDGDDKPSLVNLKGSGAIEEGGDVVMFMHRPKKIVNGRTIDVLEDYGEIIVAKAKEGPGGYIDINWDGAHQTVTEVART